jgi:hypothetical protein
MHKARSLAITLRLLRFMQRASALKCLASSEGIGGTSLIRSDHQLSLAAINFWIDPLEASTESALQLSNNEFLPSGKKSLDNPEDGV